MRLISVTLVAACLAAGCGAGGEDAARDIGGAAQQEAYEQCLREAGPAAEGQAGEIAGDIARQSCEALRP